MNDQNEKANEAKTSSEESAAEYLERVTTELARREGELKTVESALQKLRFELSGGGSKQQLYGGDPQLLAAQEAYRKSLREKIEETERVRKELLIDVARAKDRKALVEREIESEKNG